MLAGDTEEATPCFVQMAEPWQGYQDDTVDVKKTPKMSLMKIENMQLNDYYFKQNHPKQTSSVQYERNVKNDLQRNNVFNSCNSTSTGT